MFELEFALALYDALFHVIAPEQHIFFRWRAVVTLLNLTPPAPETIALPLDHLAGFYFNNNKQIYVMLIQSCQQAKQATYFRSEHETQAGSQEFMTHGANYREHVGNFKKTKVKSSTQVSSLWMRISDARYLLKKLSLTILNKYRD